MKKTILYFGLLGLLFALVAGAQEKPVNPAILKAKQDFEKKMAEAATGDPVKLHELGELHYFGRGTARNHAEAYKAYLAAAEKGHVISVATVGWMLRNEQGVGRDYKKSIEWYTKGAEKGHVESQMGLAELHYNSLGLPKRDYVTAYKWYIIAAGLGGKEAKAFVPRMLQTVLKEPHVTAEQKAVAEKSAADWLATYAKK